MAVAVLAGCGSADGRVEVSGAVTFNGKPVDYGSIQFVSSDTDADTVVITDGKYTARLTPGKKKVVIQGFKKVGVDYRDPADKSTAFDVLDHYLPPEFNTQTKLTADVTGPRGDLNFELTGKEKPGGGKPAGR
jgi:hypothetical protein